MQEKHSLFEGNMYINRKYLSLNIEQSIIEKHDNMIVTTDCIKLLHIDHIAGTEIYTRYET